MKSQLRHLNLVADTLIEAGYEVEEPTKHFDLLDVWGFVNVPGKSSRKKCFLEIYCTVIDHKEYVYSYWDVDYDQDERIEIATRQSDNHIHNIDDLIWAISEILQPINKRKVR